MKKEVITEVVFIINGEEIDTSWMEAPEVIPNISEQVIFPHIKGESTVDKITHSFHDAGEREVIHRVEISMRNVSMLQ